MSVAFPLHLFSIVRPFGLVWFRLEVHDVAAPAVHTNRITAPERLAVGDQVGNDTDESNPNYVAERMVVALSRGDKQLAVLRPERRIYLAPSAYEAGFVSGVHSEQDINDTLSAAEKVFAGL